MWACKLLGQADLPSLRFCSTSTARFLQQQAIYAGRSWNCLSCVEVHQKLVTPALVGQAAACTVSLPASDWCLKQLLPIYQHRQSSCIGPRSIFSPYATQIGVKQSAWTTSSLLFCTHVVPVQQPANRQMTDPEKASLNVAKQRPHPQDARKASFHNWAAATGAGAQTLYESLSVASKAITGKGDNECDPAETQFVFVAADSALAMSEPRAAKAQADINAELAQLKKLCPDAAACPAAFWTSARVTDMLSCLAFPPHTGPASGPQWRPEPDAPQHTISAEKTKELFHQPMMAESLARSKPGSVPQNSAVVPDLSEGTGASQAPSDGVSGFPVGTKVVLYKGRYMQLFRMLVRFKIFQLVGIAALAVPINTFLVEGSISSIQMVMATSLITGCGFASTTLWWFSQRYVGELSLLWPKHVCISVLDFWGNRQDSVVSIDRVVPPLKYLNKEELFEIANQPVTPLNVDGDRQYLMSLRHGHLVDKTRLFQILKG